MSNVSERVSPVNLKSGDRFLFEHELLKPIPPAVISEIGKAFIDKSGLVMSKCRVLPQSFSRNQIPEHWQSHRAKAKLILKSFLLVADTITNPAVWFTNQWSTNYFHWVTESLTRLMLMRDVLQDFQILIPSRLSSMPFVFQSLAPFSGSKRMLADRRYICRRLTIPYHQVNAGNYDDNLIRQTRNFYLDYFPPSSNRNCRGRIYISRRRAKVRQIANENDCEKVLDHFGFRTIYCEDMNFEQQLDAVRNASILVSNHGAGLTNLMFMQPGTSVLELRRVGDAHNNCYFALASAAGLRYFYLLCRSQLPDNGENIAKVVVDTIQLKETLESMLE